MKWVVVGLLDQFIENVVSLGDNSNHINDEHKFMP